MTSFDSDPDWVRDPDRAAEPLITAFALSGLCPPEHRWHARSTLPVLALFVAMTAEPTGEGLAWEALDPDALLAASLEAEPEEHAFLRDLLDVSAAFYGFLAARGLVERSRAGFIRARLGALALGFASAA